MTTNAENQESKGGENKGESKDQNQDKGDNKGSDASITWEFPGKDGETVRLTHEEVQERLARAGEKERGADKKFRDTADRVKAGDRAQQILMDVQAANKGDREAAQRLATYPELGITPDHVKAHLDSLDDQEADNERNPKGRKEDIRTPEEREEDQRYRRRVDTLTTDMSKRVRKEVHGALDIVLDQDKVVGHIMSSDDPRLAKATARIREYARERLERRVAAAGRKGDKFFPSPENLQAIVSEDVRAYMADIGFLENVSDSDTGASGSKAGGRSTLTIPTMGSGPRAGIPQLHRTEAPERPKDGFENPAEMAEYMLKKHEHNVASGEGDDFRPRED